MNRNVTATISHKENMKSKKIHCLVLMTKYIKKTMEMMDQLLVIRVSYKIQLP